MNNPFNWQAFCFGPFYFAWKKDIADFVVSLSFWAFFLTVFDTASFYNFFYLKGMAVLAFVCLQVWYGMYADCILKDLKGELE